MQADGFQNSPFGNTGGDSDSERSLKLNDRNRFHYEIFLESSQSLPAAAINISNLEIKFFDLDMK